MITIIAAVAQNNALGKDNQLLWHLPDDFKRFKSVTSNHYIIMGRKTFESFPKPLPNRTHVIITRQKAYQSEACLVVDSLAKAIAICPEDEEIFIIGGGEIYKQFLSYIDRIYVTLVEGNYEGDSYFPEYSEYDWKCFYEEKGEGFTYKTYIRKK